MADTKAKKTLNHKCKWKVLKYLFRQEKEIVYFTEKHDMAVIAKMIFVKTEKSNKFLLSTYFFQKKSLFHAIHTAHL